MDRLRDTLRVFVVPTEILDEELDIYEKMTYIVLRSYANGQDDTAFPSYNTIAKKGSMGRKKAIECVKKLEELGFIAKEKRKKVSKNSKISDTSNLYTIYRPAEVQKQEVVSEEHHPSVPQTLPIVSEEHHPSVPQTPENNYLKELDLKNNDKDSLTIVNLQETEIITDEIEFKKSFTDICNSFYTVFAINRWSKKQWNTLIEKFVTETIEDGRYRNIPVGKMKGYAFKSIELMAKRNDHKNGLYNPPENHSGDIPFYDWLNS